MPKKEKTKAEIERDTRQLIRLQTLMDVVFAIMIWRVFILLPRPENAIGSTKDLFDLLSLEGGSFIMVLIGIILIIIYWIQNNKIFGNLVRTDGKHTVISIFQIFFLLIYLYSIGLENKFPGDEFAFAMQSFSLALVGFAAVAAWKYARKNSLVSEVIDEVEAKELSISILPEPLASSFTLPFAFVGPGAWNLAWLSLLFFSWLLKKRHKKKFGTN